VTHSDQAALLLYFRCTPTSPSCLCICVRGPVAVSPLNELSEFLLLRETTKFYRDFDTLKASFSSKESSPCGLPCRRLDGSQRWSVRGYQQQTIHRPSRRLNCLGLVNLSFFVVRRFEVNLTKTYDRNATSVPSALQAVDFKKRQSDYSVVIPVGWERALGQRGFRVEQVCLLAPFLPVCIESDLVHCNEQPWQVRRLGRFRSSRPALLFHIVES
jgi:hypothetical protein